MQVKVLSTGSKGNCYIITNNNGERLIVDMGIPLKNIKIALDFNIQKTYAICSHKHKDHYLSYENFKRSGVPCWFPVEDSVNKKSFGAFTITAFPVKHDDIENRGFIIESDGEKLLYITDFEYCKYRFKGIKTFMVECSYDLDIISEDAENYDHSVLGHCELNTCIGFLENSVDDITENIMLIHMSSTNLDIDVAEKKITESFPNKNVVFAKEGIML